MVLITMRNMSFAATGREWSRHCALTLFIGRLGHAQVHGLYTVKKYINGMEYWRAPSPIHS